MRHYHLDHLSDTDLMTALTALVRDDCQRTADLLAHLAEVDRRQLYLAHAASSLFSYCREVLNFAEGEAYKNIYAARTARRFPVIFSLVAAGELHVSAIVVLAPRLTDENHLELLTAARRQSTEAVKALVAARFPQADARESLRRLPGPAVASALPCSLPMSALLGPTVAALEAAPVQAGAIAAPAAMHGTAAPHVQAAEPPLPRPVVAPLSAERYRLTITLSAAGREHLRTAQALLGHERPGCDLAQAVEVALAQLVERLEQRRFAKRRQAAAILEQPATAQPTTEAPAELQAHEPSSKTVDALDPQSSKTVATNPIPPRSRSRHIPAHLRRAVAERDGYCCTFREPNGRRCGSRYRLEYHHLDAFARSGEHSLDNLTLRCGPHNAYQARLDFGAAGVRLE